MSRKVDQNRPLNRYLWAMLLARIYNLFPLLRPEGSALGVLPARGPPSWDDYDQDMPVDENEQSILEYE